MSIWIELPDVELLQQAKREFKASQIVIAVARLRQLRLEAPSEWFEQLLRDRVRRCSSIESSPNQQRKYIPSASTMSWLCQPWM